MKSQNIQANNRGGLGRGIRFLDVEVGRRRYNYNGYGVSDEYYIHQWKETNDIPKEHPTGTHGVYKNFGDFFAQLKSLIAERNKKY